MNPWRVTLIRVPKLLALTALLLVPATAVPARADDLKDGRSALLAGRYDDAIKAFEKAAGQGFAEGRAGVGQVWLRRRQYDRAMEAFQTAQKMTPGLETAYWGQGEVLRRPCCRSCCATRWPIPTCSVYRVAPRWPPSSPSCSDCRPPAWTGSPPSGPSAPACWSSPSPRGRAAGHRPGWCSPASWWPPAPAPW